jgi:glycerol-3-phosphate acyltransferase PlsY
MPYVLSVIIGYLIGCSHMSFYISKIKNVNLKEKGSKNYGASNTVAMVGFKAGFIVFLHDLLKAYFAVLIARWLFPDVIYADVIAGLFAVVGHIYPFYLKFDGGKGFAAFMGAMIGIEPVFTLCLMLFALIFALIVDYIVAGTFIIITIAPIHIAAMNHDINLLVLIGIISLVILFKHRENIKNLITKNGKEMRIRAALKKKYK